MSKPEEIALPLPSSLQQVVGALVYGADHPLTVDEIRKILVDVAKEDGSTAVFAEASPRDVRDAMTGITKELERIGLGIELVEVGGQFRVQTQACCGRWLRHMLHQERPNRLSRPALETLAIIAYRQPIAKSEIEGIRGVTVDHILKALMELHLVRIVGRSDLPGRPFLYGTTTSFLDHFGLKNLNELNEMDPTLQRSKTSDRNAIHRKPAQKTTPGESGKTDASAPKKGAAEPDPIREVLGPDTPPPPDAEPIHEPSSTEGESTP